MWMKFVIEGLHSKFKFDPHLSNVPITLHKSEMEIYRILKHRYDTKYGHI